MYSVSKKRCNNLLRSLDTQGKALDGNDYCVTATYSCFLLPEICAISKISKKEIGRCFKLILKALETSVDLITTADFMVS